METRDAVNWIALATRHSKQLVAALRQKLDAADSSVIEPELLAAPLNVDVGEVVSLLREVASFGALLVSETKLCGNCSHPVTPDDEAGGICPNCGRRYLELDPPQFKSKLTFTLPAGRESRDIPWLVTAHGMNTDGPWQQDFSWLIANKLKYSAPVLILKYPLIRLRALFTATQTRLVTDLGEKLKVAADYAGRRDAELGQRPDVVLHSYGTLLFSKLLLDSRFDKLAFGRVILAGSIVRPDYGWQRHIDAGRVTAVLNHCGEKDWIVELAEYAIPGSGPSGRRGFRDPAVRNIQAAGYGHGSFFEVDELKTLLQDDGAWDRFYTYPPERLTEPAAVAVSKPWQPLPGWVRPAVVTIVALIVVAIIYGAWVLAARLLGL